MKATLLQSAKGQEFLKTLMISWKRKLVGVLERMAEINVPTWLEEPTLLSP